MYAQHAYAKDFMINTQLLRDTSNILIKIEDRVRILCPGDDQFYNKIGIVKIIDLKDYKVFVQMVTSGGGTWWHGQFVRIQPELRKLRKPHTPHKQSAKINVNLEA